MEGGRCSLCKCSNVHTGSSWRCCHMLCFLRLGYAAAFLLGEILRQIHLRYYLSEVVDSGIRHRSISDTLPEQGDLLEYGDWLTVDVQQDSPNVQA